MANINERWKEIWQRLRWLGILALLLLLASSIDWPPDNRVTQREKEFDARQQELQANSKENLLGSKIKVVCAAKDIAEGDTDVLP